MKVGSLFSGAGIGDYGLSLAGLSHAWFCETDEYSRRVLELRFPGKTIYGDIRGVYGKYIEKVDIISGGFPCQDISTAGKGAGIREGNRSGLWYEYARIIDEIRPKWVVIENVAAIRNKNGGLGIVLQDLAEIGYDAEWQVLRAFDFGLPHRRERLFVIAYPNSERLEKFWEGASWDKISEQQTSVQDNFDSTVRRFWETAARTYRGTNGTPHRVDRLRCIGNGIVPFCTEFIGRRIIEIEVERELSK